VVRAETPRNGFGASLRGGMERRGARTRFYRPKTVPRKEGEDLDSDSVGGNDEKKSDSRCGKEEGALTGGPTISAARCEEGGSARELG
jgi:hypothetical protein